MRETLKLCSYRSRPLGEIRIDTLPHYHIKKCVDILGGRTYPVRYYPIALRLRDIAFGNEIAQTDDVAFGNMVAKNDALHHWATCTSAFPK